MSKNGIAAIRLIPPLDIAFCWMLHRLSPKAYEADCISLFGTVLPAGQANCAGPEALCHVWVGNAAEEDSVLARLQWPCHARAARPQETRELYGGVIPRLKLCRTSFRVFLPRYCWPVMSEKGAVVHEFSFDKVFAVNQRWQLAISYDIEAAAKRQKTFFFNVMTEYYERDTSLRNAVTRYVRFLTLMREHPNKFLVPMYDIDLVWHAHIASTVAYERDCESFVGRFIDHQEGDDRSESGKVVPGFRRTEELWRQHFSEPYSTRDTCYRGKPNEANDHVGYPTVGAIVPSQTREDSFVNSATCSKCAGKWKKHRSIGRLKHEECKLAIRQISTLARMMQVGGGGCGGLYAEGVNSVMSWGVGMPGAASCGGGSACGADGGGCGGGGGCDGAGDGCGGGGGCGG
jgi:hypothetical protein